MRPTTSILPVICIGSLLSATVPAMAAKRRPEPEPQTSAPLRDLSACKGIIEDTARLACYDKSAAALLAAENRADVFVVDRVEVEKTRRSLFGLSLPSLSLFAQHGAPMEELDHIDDILASAGKNSSGQYVFHLQNGQIWQQTDLYELGSTPRSGDKVEVKRAALNSFKLSVNGHSAVRVRRLE